MRLALSAGFAVLATAAMAGSPAGAAGRVLVPHRAVYDLALDKASDRSGISGLTGRMVYEFNGSPCEGYTVNFRFVTRIEQGDTSRLTDQQTTTFEDGAGKTFSFVTKSFVDQNLDKEVKGVATRVGGDTDVKIDKPDKQELKLGTSLFPTAHMLDLLDKADKGETFYETSMFDGSDQADRLMTTTVIIGKETAPKADDPEEKAAKLIQPANYRPVTIAYYDPGKKDGEETPDYRITFKMHDNGITRDLTMDYGDFSMKGQLVDLALYPAAKPCK